MQILHNQPNARGTEVCGSFSDPRNIHACNILHGVRSVLARLVPWDVFMNDYVADMRQRLEQLNRLEDQVGESQKRGDRSLDDRLLSNPYARIFRPACSYTTIGHTRGRRVWLKLDMACVPVVTLFCP
jgi:hypothetical protein